MGFAERLKRTIVFAVMFTAEYLASGVASALPGDLDGTFGEQGVASAPSVQGNVWPTKILVRNDGAVLVVATCTQGEFPYEVDPRPCLFQLTRTGAPDLTFATNGIGIYAGPRSAPDVSVIGAALDSDNRVTVLATCNWQPCVFRLTSSGEMDPGFGDGGFSVLPAFDGVRVNDIALQADGRSILLASSVSGAMIIRISDVGSWDLTFADNGRADGPSLVGWGAAKLAIDVEGNIYVGGTCSSTFLQPFGRHLCIWKVGVDGAAAIGYGTNGFSHVFPATRVYDADRAVVLIQANLGVVVGATCNPASWAFCAVRFRLDGSIDQQFALSGELLHDITSGQDELTSGALGSGGQLMLAGPCSNGFATCVTRYTQAGQQDTTFGKFNSGIAKLTPPHAATIAMQQNEKILIFSACATPTTDRVCLARLKGGPYPASACTLNADANSTIAASSDAMLVTRYLLGFRGEALTNGAIGQNAARTADEIVTYLDSLKNDPLKKLDLDGDGESLAMTDGLLMLRAMLGLSGDALTVGAMGRASAAYPTLRTPQQILQWIESTHGVACLP